MVNYQNAKIYKVVSDSANLIYIGSTTNKYLSQRLGEHQGKYNSYQRGLTSYITSFKLMECPDRRIELIEKFPCESKDELSARERYWIENTRCVNHYIPSRTRNERYQINREDQLRKHKEWRSNNKDRIKSYKSSTPEYKAKQAESNKKYRETHREEIKAYRSTPEYKAKKAEWDKRYREKKRE